MNPIIIKNNIGIPKYKQIVSSIEEALVNGSLKKGDKLPSVNSVRNKFSLSRDTVFMAFNELKTRGIIESIPGKGFYVKSENVDVAQKVFLLFDELNAFKEDLYNSFLENLGENIHVDIYFHHFNYNLFEKLIVESLGNYNYYVIMPANLNKTNSVIQRLPKEKVYILDQIHDDLKTYSAIYQNFEDDIYTSLNKAKNLLVKYDKIVLLFPEKKQPLGMLTGFNKFKKESNLPCEVINSIKNRIPKKGETYLILDDQNLIVLIKKLKDLKLKLGEDVGIISYNDTLLKEIVEDGITTISTDFKQMGKRLAQMIKNKEQISIKNPNSLIIRNSL